jgi:hypothetical protein
VRVGAGGEAGVGVAQVLGDFVQRRRYPRLRIALNWNQGTMSKADCDAVRSQYHQPCVTKTPADRANLTLRLALALEGAYSAGDYSADWACDPRRGSTSDPCNPPAARSYPRAKHVPDWSIFGRWP